MIPAIIYLTGISLLQCTRSLKRKFLEPEIWDLTIQGLTGLEYLHQFGIRHHNIKRKSMNLIIMAQK